MPEEVPKKTENRKTISRREFLKDAGLIVGGATVGSMALINACGGTTTVTAPGTTVTKTSTVTNNVTTTVAGSGATVTTTVTQQVGAGATVTTTTPGPTVTKTVQVGGQQISFTVNGKPYTKVVDPCWDLHYFLHDVLGYYDIKTFCYRGACGSCTVIMNGRPILSCMALAVDADGAKIETAEGIATANHALIEPYIKNHCMQCGYCTPGFVTTAKALLDRNPNPTDHDIIEALAGNLCRCGTYPQHVIAIKEAAAAIKGGA
jgi:aerobic-type carbon monoxide dehydrogenase small subunit (CoxS/CutS family)